MADDFDIFPPNGFDWADGLRGIGTPTPPAALKQVPAGIFFEEEPDSPTIERGEQMTVRHRYRCDSDTGMILSLGVYRGVFFKDSTGLITRVLTSTLTRQRGDTSIFEVVSEGINLDSPPDEFHVEEVEFNPAIERHPNYWGLTGDGVDRLPYNMQRDADGFVVKVNPALLSGPEIVDLCKKAAEAASAQAQSGALLGLSLTAIGGASPSETAQKAYKLALRLYNRYLKQETDFYLSGWKVTWSQYYWLPTPLDPGGYIQDPVADHALPSFFWSDTQEPDGENIFVVQAEEVNPDIYLAGISWLRMADRFEYSRTWFKITRSWIGGPLGHWDKDVYPVYDGSGRTI